MSETTLRILIYGTAILVIAAVALLAWFSGNNNDDN
jgi:hypothetical protein